MAVRQRLRRLEGKAQQLGYLGCPGCRERRGVATLVDVPDLRHGIPQDDLPAPCRACGTIPEQIIAIHEVIITAAGQ
jgi:hypothetical protein